LGKNAGCYNPPFAAKGAGLINDRIGLNVSDLAEVRMVAAAYGVEEQPFAPTKQGGSTHSGTPSSPENLIGHFVLDWHWNKHWVRFHRRFIGKLEAAELVIHRENGGGKNCSVRYEDFKKALDICCTSTSR
jgi:hypothetical protein